MKTTRAPPPEDEDEDYPPDGPGSDDPGDDESCSESEEGANPLDPATGNVRRKIDDLRGLGAPKLQRFHNSQSRFGLKQRPFGNGGDWRHSWQYDLVLDRAAPGGPTLQFIYPSGFRIGLKPAATAGAWTALHDGPERAELQSSGELDFITATDSRICFALIETDSRRTWYAPASLTQTDGRVFTFERDAAGWLTRLTDPDGRWLHFVYQQVTIRVKPWQTVATLAQIPATGQWAEIAIPPGLRRESDQVRLRLPRKGRLAEVRFLAESGAVLPGGDIPVIAAAFDGDESTAVTAGQFVPTLQTGRTVRPAGVRLLAATGSGASLAEAYLECRAIEEVTEIHRVLARLETGDGRAVDYDYAASPQKAREQVVLTTVRYGDGTAAHYGYSTDKDNYGFGALLVAADDPRYSGPAKRIRYDYYGSVADQQLAGTIKAEINPSTGHAWARLEIDRANPLTHTVGYSDDRFHRYQLAAGERKAVVARTDSLGRTTRFEYTKDDGRPSAVIDYAGRRKENRRDESGRIVSTRDAKGRAGTIQRDAHGRTRRVADAHGRVTVFERDAAGRPVRITQPGGKVHEYTRDRAGRVVARKSPGRDATFAYDSQGRQTSRTDALGGVTRFERDNHGRVYRVIDPLGRSTRYERNERGRITKKVTPDGLARAYAYDNYGRKIAETDAAGRTATFAYDELSRMTRQMDFAGRVTTYEYAEFPGGCGSCSLSQRPTRIVGPDGVATALLYDTEGRLLARTLASGTDAEATTTYDYDADDNLIATTDPLGRITRYAYDDEHHRLSATDPLGRATRWTYDEHGNVLATTAPDGRVTRSEYDANDRPIKITDAAGQVTRREYDILGNVTVLIDATGQVTRHTYQGKRHVAMIHPDGKRQAWEYDAAGRVIRENSPDGVVTATTYDAGNRVLTRSQLIPGVAQPATTLYSYDTLGRRLTTTDPLSRVTRWAYDTAGNVLAEIRPDGRQTSHTYDARNRRTSTIDAAGGVTRFEYDAADNNTALTDARGNTYRFTYDAQRRKTAIKYPDGSQESWAYDLTGRLVRHITRAGQIRTMVRNAVGMTVSETWSPAGAAPNVTYTYNPVGQLTGLDNGLTRLGYTYDVLGRMASETTDLSPLVPGLTAQTVRYEYDTLGRGAALVYPDRSKVSYAYDKRGRLQEVTANRGQTIGRYGYDALGRIGTLTRDNDVATSYAYDVAGRLTDIAHGRGNKELAVSRYALDILGRRTAQTREDNLTENYAYDATSQLTGVEYGDDRAESFAYDLVGNRVVASVIASPGSQTADTAYIANTLNQYTQVGAVSFTYDANGNLTGDGKRSFRYDAQNRLVVVESAGVRAEFFHDARNRCVLRKYYTPGSQGQWVLNAEDSRALTYDTRWNLISERTLGGGSAGRYIHGIRTDEILEWTAGDGTKLSPLADGLGSTLALADARGRVTRRYRYAAYGQPTALNPDYTQAASGAFPQDYRFLFTGREWLAKVRLNDHRNRNYSPELGRWTATDPIGFKGNDVNLFRYSGNRPSAATDPFGLYFDCGEITGEGIGAVLAAGPFDAQAANEAAQEAEAHVSGMDGIYGGEADAVRHCTWTCSMTRRIGYDDSMDIANNHENYCPPPDEASLCGNPSRPDRKYPNYAAWRAADESMDLRNNEYGAMLGSAGSTPCGTLCDLALDAGRLQVNQPGGY